MITEKSDSTHPVQECCAICKQHQFLKPYFYIRSAGPYGPTRLREPVGAHGVQPVDGVVGVDHGFGAGALEAHRLAHHSRAPAPASRALPPEGRHRRDCGCCCGCRPLRPLRGRARAVRAGGRPTRTAAPWRPRLGAALPASWPARPRSGRCAPSRRACRAPPRAARGAGSRRRRRGAAAERAGEASSRRGPPRSSGHARAG
jgi:hypothetical protein